jgi:hypothetical protein
MTGSTTIKVEDQDPGLQGAPQMANGDIPPLNWESELQLVSSLAKLQELERKVSLEPPTCSIS